MLAVCIVAEHNPSTAEEIIKDRIGPDEQVIGMWPLPPSAIMALDWKPGQFTFWRDPAMKIPQASPRPRPAYQAHRRY
jgi:hypothetical protein